MSRKDHWKVVMKVSKGVGRRIEGGLGRERPRGRNKANWGSVACGVRQDGYKDS